MRHVASTKGSTVLEGLLANGWKIKRREQLGHPVLARDDHPDFLFAFEAEDDLGPVMVSRIARKTGRPRVM